MKKASTLSAFFVLLGFFANAQGWETTFGKPVGNDVFYDLLESPTGDGGLVFVGQTEGADGSTDAFFVRTNALGRPLAQNSFGETGADEVAQVILQMADGAFLIAVNQRKNGLDSLFFQKIDAGGSLVFTKKAAVSGAKIWGGTPTSDGHFLFCGEVLDGSQARLFLIKVDFQGNEIWQKTTPLGDECHAQAIVPTSDGGGFIGGWAKLVGTNGADAILLKINELGDIIWTQPFGNGLTEFAFGLAQTTDGRLVLAGFQEDGVSDSDPFLAFFDQNGAFLDDVFFDKPAVEELRSATLLADGSLAFCGSSQINPTAERDILLIKTDAFGATIFESKIGGTGGENAWAVAAKMDGSLALAGRRSRCAGANCLDASAIQTDENGAFFGGRIQGKLWLDSNSDCVGDAGLEGWKIEARSATQTFFTESKSDGFFELEVPTGAFDLRAVLPGGGAWQTGCGAFFPISILQMSDSISQDLWIQKAVDCPVLQVDIATENLRKCDTSEYVLTVKNWGSAVAQNAQIQVTLDPFMEAVSGAANPLNFAFGDIQPLDNQRLTFKIALACAPNFDRQTHAIQAQATPDLLCQIPANWDQSDLTTEAICDADSVRIKIRNIGLPTSSDSEFIITEDELPRIVPTSGGSIPFPFLPSSTIQKSFESDGSTFTVRARNTPNHPSGTRPFAFIEGCGSGPFQSGFPLQFAQNDGLPQVEIDCREGWVGTDPDFLKAFPTGFGVLHLIEKSDPIDYLFRFQNTTGQNAKRLEIRDTLSPFLDPRRVEIGAASHPFSLEWRGERTMVFVFDSINLADSARGFLKIRILPDSSAALGAVIINKTAAFFDFAAPVFSNTTFHTIGQESDYLMVSATKPTTAQNLPIRATPNPFSENCRLDWPGAENDVFSIRLTDLAGRVLMEKATVGPTFLIEKGSMPSGFFLVQVIQNQRVMGFEKLILK